MGYGDGRAEANAAVLEVIEDEIAQGREIGVQVAGYVDGELVVDCWAGLADREAGTPVGPDTLFNTFSVTKAVAATALHVQVEKGLVDYDAPVVRYWPEYGAAGKEETKVGDLVTHRSGVPQMPAGMTPERMADWNWMVDQIAALAPMAPPGSQAMYQAMTFGWLVGEVVRRSDPQGRSFGAFVREEVGAPLGAPDLWIGLPDAELPRVARLYDDRPPSDPSTRGPLYSAAAPLAVDLTPQVFEQPIVRAAEVPGVGGIFTARSEARLWAMLACGGTLDGTRLLSETLVARLFEPRGNSDEPDKVMYNIPLGLSLGGYWLGAERPSVWAAPFDGMVCHPGAGNSMGWADATNRSAVAICHNRLTQPRERDQDSILRIAEAVRRAMGVR